MNETATHPTPADPPLSTLLAEPLRVGEPDLAGPLAVYPVFGPEPRIDYRPFAEAIADGFRVGELDAGASVNDLAVENPTAHTVLIYEGEEVLGAQQNRTFDTSVLVGPGAKLRLPVSCVEVGRWDGRRHRESLRAASETAYPRLRRANARQSRERVAAGLDARADQRQVWDEVAAKAARLGVGSPTGAMHDIFEGRRDRLAETREAIRLCDGQIGAVATVGGEIQVLDLVSRPDAFAHLHPVLVEGYALDALEDDVAGGEAAEDVATARGFTLLVTDCALSQRTPGAGLGVEHRFADAAVCGTALAHDGELIALTAFPTDPLRSERERAIPTTRVRRPSRRR